MRVAAGRVHAVERTAELIGDLRRRGTVRPERRHRLVRARAEAVEFLRMIEEVQQVVRLDREAVRVRSALMVPQV
jgi:hypothetical protein